MRPGPEEPAGAAGGRPMGAAAAIAALAVLAALALAGRPAGLGLALLELGLVGVAARSVRSWDGWTVAWVAAAAVLAAMPALRAAGWVVALSGIGAAALASLAVAGGAGARQLAAGLAAAPARAPLGPVSVLAPLLPRSVSRAAPALRGGALAAVLLAVFVPLFVSADAAFAQLVEDAVPHLELGDAVDRALLLLAVLAAGGGLLRAAGARPPAARPPSPRLARLEWALPLGTLVALFAAFVALQLTTLFGGHDHVLRTTGLTYAEYAHQGFGQLMAVAALTLAVIAAALHWARRAGAGDERLLRGLLGALCALTLVVLASALKRLGLYEDAYGFTRLRFLAHAQILWLGGLFALVLVAGAFRRAPWLPRAAVALSAAAALTFALADPDRRIAERNVDRHARTGKVDRSYLAGLSADAVPALARLPRPLGGCATARVRWTLARERDGLAGLNRARARARAALAGVPACPG